MQYLPGLFLCPFIFKLIKLIKPVNPKGNHFSIFIGRTGAETDTPILGHLIQKSDSLEKTLMLGKIEGRKRRE